MATHFELFNLPLSVDLDVKALDDLHRKLSLETHPDRLTGADARERRIAAEKSASLNEAVKVLRDPVRRAFYVLELKGVKLDTEHAAAALKMPMEFLEEIMERREALDGARQARELSRAQSMAKEIAALKSASLSTAQTALRADDVPTASIALGKVRYYSRFLEEVEAFEEELAAS
ncbi:MAG: Fe-S protein assembly co-chaperone HscB [Archangium sp.]|nr:Fe-S protein assembly co-chaperone HscB [Archangium sp.]